MSGLAGFGLKYPSLLQFENDCREETTRANLKTLYGAERAPSDTRFRERLDELDPSHLRPLCKRPFAELQRGKGLEGFADLDNHHLISIDGTGYFPSQTIHCARCAEQHHRNGTATQSDHTFLFNRFFFDCVAASEHTAEASFSEENGFRRRFRYLNGVPLNDANFDLEANVLAREGSVTQFSWVAQIPVTESNLITRMREARARWKVENDTFNTLKSQGGLARKTGHPNQNITRS